MINKWKDKWFYYKLVSAILILGGILAIYLYHMIAKVWLRDINYPFSYALFQYQFISFFTYQTNLIIGVWFLIAVIYHNKKNKFIGNQNITFAITCYISVTCITYILVLLPGIFLSKKPVSAKAVTTGLFFHVITPTLMIFYALKNVQYVPQFKKYYRRNFFLYAIYPLGYIVFLLTRLFIYYNIPALADAPFHLVFPYGLVLNLNGTIEQVLNSVAYTFMAFLGFCVVIPFFFVGINFFYFYVYKKIYQKQLTKKKQLNQQEPNSSI